MKALLFILALSLSIWSQVAVVCSDNGNATSRDVQIVAKAVESELKALGYEVLSGRDELLKEQAFQNTGIVNDPVEIGNLIGAKELITLSVDKDRGMWSVCLSHISGGGVNLGSECKDVEGRLSDCLTAVRYLTRVILGVDTLARDAKVVRIHDKESIILHDRTVTVVHREALGNDVEKIFIPCSFCQGKGKLMNGNDCPYCAASSKFMGRDTHGMCLTGHWEYQR